jgi:hypothetical protein
MLGYSKNHWGCSKNTQRRFSSLISPFSVLACGLLLSCACVNQVNNVVQQFNKAPQIDAFTKAVKVCLPLAYASNVAMDAVNEVVTPGVSVSRTPPDSFPCNAVIRIAVDNAHPLPVGSDTVNGSMTVIGFWSDSNTALASVFFTKTNLNDGTFTLQDVAFVPVTRDTSGTMVVFASEDVNADSSLTVNTKITDSLITVKFSEIPLTLPTDSSVAVNQKAWIAIAKRPAGAGLGGEIYTMYGASQYLGVSPSTTEMIQAVMIAVTMTPLSCRRNPWGGYAMVRDLRIQGSDNNSSVDLGTVVLTFGAACTGTVKIPIATGEYLGRIGSNVALNLDR